MAVRWTLPLLLVVAVGCDGSSPPPDWMAERDSTGFLPLQESPDLCLDCIVMERVVELGEAEGPGYVEYTQVAVQDQLGRFWLSQRHEIKVFGPTGDFVQVVGRAGQGPMEWDYPWPVHVDKDGNLHIIDQGNIRESVVTPDFELKAERPIPWGEIRALEPLPNSDRYVASMWRLTDEALGFPLHIIDGEEILHSFGATGGISQQNHHNSRRRLAVDLSGRIFSAKENHLEIEVWTETGERIGGLSGPLLNEIEVKPTLYNRDDNPLPNKIMRLQAIDSTMLVVVSRRPVENWREHFVEREVRPGLVTLAPKEGVTYNSVHTSRIEVIDLRSRMIIARQDLEESGLIFTGPGLLLDDRIHDLRKPHFVVWRMRLNLDKR